MLTWCLGTCTLVFSSVPCPQCLKNHQPTPPQVNGEVLHQGLFLSEILFFKSRWFSYRKSISKKDYSETHHKNNIYRDFFFICFLEHFLCNGLLALLAPWRYLEFSKVSVFTTCASLFPSGEKWSTLSKSTCFFKQNAHICVQILGGAMSTSPYCYHWPVLFEYAGWWLATVQTAHCSLVIWVGMLLCSPGCPGTHYTGQAGLKCAETFLPLPPECWDERFTPKPISFHNWFWLYQVLQDVPNMTDYQKKESSLDLELRCA